MQSLSESFDLMMFQNTRQHHMCPQLAGFRGEENPHHRSSRLRFSIRNADGAKSARFRDTRNVQFKPR